VCFRVLEHGWSSSIVNSAPMLADHRWRTDRGWGSTYVDKFAAATPYDKSAETG